MYVFKEWVYNLTGNMSGGKYKYTFIVKSVLTIFYIGGSIFNTLNVDGGSSYTMSTTRTAQLYFSNPNWYVLYAA